MPIQRLHTERRYSEIVIHNRTVYLAGQLADDYAGDVAEQGVCQAFGLLHPQH